MNPQNQFFYRHPRSQDYYVIVHLNETLKKNKNENKKVILTGDFNINLLKWNKSKEAYMTFSISFQKWFTPHIIEPTQVPEKEK